MFRNILVPLDGSENAYRTLEYAANLAKKFDSQINVLSVFRHHSYMEKSIAMVRPREPENLDDVLSADSPVPEAPQSTAIYPGGYQLVPKALEWCFTHDNKPAGVIG